MNKCILFSLGLARAGATNEKKKKKKNLKQMVKSNKKEEASAGGAGGRGGTERHKKGQREGGEIKMKRKTQALCLSFPF